MKKNRERKSDDESLQLHGLVEKKPQKNKLVTLRN